MSTSLGDSSENDDPGRQGTAIEPTARPRPQRLRRYQRLADEDRGSGGQSNSDFLGLFSIGLGLAEFLAPVTMSRIVGVKHPDDRNRNTMRLMGAREIGHGLAILSSPDPAAAVWARVAGDVLDLALLARVFANEENDRGRTLFAVANVAAVAALDWMTARELSQQPDTPVTEALHEGIIRTVRSVTVRKPVEEVYAYWRDFENLPRFMRHLESVRVIDDRRSHWKAKAPAGKSVEWDAEITDDVDNQRISWRSVEESEVGNRGTVEFTRAPGGRGTEVRVTLEYDPPFGKLGSKIAMLWREEPGQQVADDLGNFKQVMETGEVLVSDATVERGPHPARPPRQAGANRQTSSQEARP